MVCTTQGPWPAPRFVGYYDSDLADDNDTSRGTSRTMFFLGNYFVNWQSLKQKLVALSSCDAEYIATTTQQHKLCGCKGCWENSLAERSMWWS
jgi:hypothetical protein